MSLITVVYEKLSNISSERNTQYEVYESSNLQKLDISICKDSLIDIYVPLTLSQDLQNLYEETKDLGYDLFNLNNKFYQDICTPYKSSNGADILLSDRIDYYYNNDETRCQSNCNFSDYLIESKYLKCKCDDSNSEINTKDSQKFNPEIIYKSFYDVLKFSNYKVLKCYKLVFLIDRITNNAGSIITIVYAVIYTIFIILYLIKGNKEINRYLGIIKNKKISKKINKNNINNLKNQSILKIEEKNDNQKIKSTKTKEHKNKRKKNLKSGKNLGKNKIKKFKNYHNENEEDNLVIVNNKKISIRNENNITKIKDNLILSKSKSDIFLFNNRQIQNLKDDKRKKSIKFSKKLKLDNYELNNLEYDKAIIFDKRKLIDIYWSLLRREHLILFTFCNRNDYNIIYIK